MINKILFVSLGRKLVKLYKGLIKRKLVSFFVLVGILIVAVVICLVRVKKVNTYYQKDYIAVTSSQVRSGVLSILLDTNKGKFENKMSIVDLGNSDSSTCIYSFKFDDGNSISNSSRQDFVKTITNYPVEIKFDASNLSSICIIYKINPDGEFKINTSSVDITLQGNELSYSYPEGNSLDLYLDASKVKFYTDNEVKSKSSLIHLDSSGKVKLDATQTLLIQENFDNIKKLYLSKYNDITLYNFMYPSDYKDLEDNSDTNSDTGVDLNSDNPNEELEDSGFKLLTGN